MKVQQLFLTIFSLILFSCETKDQTAKMEENLNHEIQNRLNILKQLAHSDDSLASIYASLHKESERLIMLSRDHENPTASINSANQYFGLLSRAIPSGTEGPMVLRSGMNPKEMQLAIKQNELWILNNLIFLQKDQEIKLFSVKD
jgi:hypothetical protein